MKTFKIHINGETYEVGVEEIGGGYQQTYQETTPKPEPITTEPAPQKEEPKEQTPSKPPVPEGAGEKVTAPLPGTILDIKVTNGQQVTEGEVLIILEAMKMENEITAPVSGVIGEILVSKGKTVNSGDILLTIK